MQKELVIKGRTLGGCADLTLLAPIKPGFVESLESVTYKTRIKRVLETLHGARLASHEYQTARLLSDAVERVGAIHSVRVAVLEPENKVLLAVTFDGSWEAYIRVLWDKVGTLLDLIFCGTVDYVTAAEHSFAEWLEWARRVQVETGFFYGPPEASAQDMLYQRRVEMMRARGNGSELDELRASSPSAEDATQRLVRLTPPEPDDPQYSSTDHVRMVRERIRNGLQGLAGLYRLTDLHRPNTRDGDVLRRAALNLLLEFVQMRDSNLIPSQLEEERKDRRFLRQLEWLFPVHDAPAAVPRPVPAPAIQRPKIPDEIRSQVQGGILRGYEGATHAVVLLLAFDTPAIALAFLKYVTPKINCDREADYQKAIHANLAFTGQGLRATGLSEDEVELFPEEFRQGMAARGGLLGDVRNNHPRRWHLPRAFVDVKTPLNQAVGIEIDSVHAVLQFRCAAARGPLGLDTYDLSQATHPLRQEVQSLIDGVPGIRVLSAQSLRRRFAERPSASGQSESVVVEHFGYADGSGQPDVEPQDVPFDRNRIQLGEVVLGHDNAVDFNIDPDDPRVPPQERERQRWLCNGSFLAMRKYRQFVGRLESAVNATVAEMLKALPALTADVCREIVYGKLMGRLRDGTPMVAPEQTAKGQQNLFDYEEDKKGEKCPLSAHVRRGHPRTDPAVAGRVPRVMRRSMSYGPAQQPGAADDGADRGLLFMAYNADLGEQFEVVQRWLTGGNSTGTSSGQSCPIVGVPSNGVSRNFRFEHEGRVFRVVLEVDNKLFDEPPALTRMEWGIYLFAPSLSVLQRLCTKASTAVDVWPSTPTPWNVSLGRKLLAHLKDVHAQQGDEKAAEAWKGAIEDPDAIDKLESAALWAAIRSDHGGLLRTPYGVLVADRDLIRDVFVDPGARYSVCGQFERMKKSFGEISLGMDKGPVYDRESEPINTEIGKLKENVVFKTAYDSATNKIDAIVARAKKQAVDVSDARFEVGLDAREIADHVLADLSEAWFGLADDGVFFKRGGTDWNWKRGEPPLYPGHFTALSRYMFQPNPGPMSVELGQRYGQALRESMRAFVADRRAAGGFSAPLAKAIFGHPTHGTDDDFVARNMVGVLMGFNPTIIGAVLNVLREWQRDGSFGVLRAQLVGVNTYAAAAKVLAGPMAAAARVRPMPQLGWRTALKSHRIGGSGPDGIDVVAGDMLVLGIASGTQQSQADGQHDHRIMFGGDRGLKPSHPTHACPGYVAGLGAMMGTLTALLSREENLRPGAAPLTYFLEGQSDFSKMPAVKVALAAPALTASESKGRLDIKSRVHEAVGGAKPLTAAPGRILGWGDSWLDYLAKPFGLDLRDCLELRGYIATPRFCVWTDWPRVETMAANTGPFCAFLKHELQLHRPRAILLSGGGNDSTEGRLEDLIIQNGEVTKTILHPDKLRVHIEQLGKHYETILNALAKVFVDTATVPVPVLVHGYDYPIPRGVLWRPWLFTPFANKGYDCSEPADLILATKGMGELIDEFNERIAKFDKRISAMGFDFVRYVKLTGTLTAAQWANDLHPDTNGFTALADKIDAEIQKLPIV